MPTKIHDPAAQPVKVKLPNGDEIEAVNPLPEEYLYLLTPSARRTVYRKTLKAFSVKLSELDFVTEQLLETWSNTIWLEECNRATLDSFLKQYQTLQCLNYSKALQPHPAEKALRDLGKEKIKIYEQLVKILRPTVDAKKPLNKTAKDLLAEDFKPSRKPATVMQSRHFND